MMGKPIQFDEAGDSGDLQALFDNIAAGAPPVTPEPPPVRRGPSGEAGDSADLEDLFDSVSASSQPEPPQAPKAPPPPPPPSSSSSGDSDELESLFDSVADASAPGQSVPAKSVVAATEGDSQEVVFNRLGHLARQLHDNMRELGVDRIVEEGARQVPDVRERLMYISKMTEQAAERVFNAADIAKPIQDQMLQQSTEMSARWDKMFANQLSVPEFKLLAADTRAYFNAAPEKHKNTNAQLMEITLAQDFQDLTGQVIKKIVDIIQSLETQLLSVLIESMPPQLKAESSEVIEHSGLMNGPVITADGRSDIVTSQAQVDDLLESLGF